MIVRKCGSGEGGRQQHHRWFVHPAANQGGNKGGLRRVGGWGVEGLGVRGNWMGGIEGFWLTMPLSEEMMVTDYDPNLNTHIHFLGENQDNNLQE